MQADLNDLRLIESRDNDFGASAEFQQFVGDLAVDNARVQVNFDKEGRVLQVISSYTPVTGPLPEAKLTKKEATLKAIDTFLRSTALKPSKDNDLQGNGVNISPSGLKLTEPPKVEELLFQTTEGRPRRVYQTLIKAVRPFGIKEVLIDATTGDVLLIRDYVYSSVDGHGLVFNPNPVNSLNNSNLLDQDDSDSAVPFDNPNPYYTVTLPALDAPPGGPFTLKGPYVVLEDIEPPTDDVAKEASADDFNYHRHSKYFEDVMVYYHIDRNQRHIQQLGFTNVMNRQLRADAHGNYEADNSHYVASPEAPGYGYVAFGDGGVDDAEDADVIIHEYGHAIQDNQAPGKYSKYNGQTRAMGEGFGDYWAASSFAEESAHSGHSFACVMEWDQTPCRRYIDRNRTADDYDDTLPAYINCLIWSRTLYDIFVGLQKDVADKLIIESHFNVPDSPSFLQGADAIITADRQIFAGAHVEQLCSIFKSRKIYHANDCPTKF